MPERSDNLRAFFAVNLEPRIVEEIREIQNRFRHLEGIRWVHPERMHITLTFLGEIEQNRVDQLSRVLAEPAREVAAFSLSFRGAGVFPNLKNPRVLWLGVDEGREELRQIHALIQEALSYKERDRRFSPHVTLGRRKKNADLHLDAGLLSDEIFCPGKQRVDRFHLMKSTLQPAGPIYEPLQEFFLKS